MKTEVDEKIRHIIDLETMKSKLFKEEEAKNEAL